MSAQIFSFGIGLTLVGDDAAMAGVEGLIDTFEDLSQQVGDLSRLPGVDSLARAAREAEPEVNSLRGAIVGANESLGALYDTAHEIKAAFAGIGEAVMSTNIFDLEHQAVRLTARLAEGRVAADNFQDSVLDIASSTETSLQTVGDIAFQMKAAGLEFDTASEAGRNNAETLAYMADTMGIGADAAARFASSGRLIGASITEMRDEALLFEKVYDIPGLLEQMPAAAQTAISAQARFGKQVTGSSRDATFAVTKMAGQFSKALGKTAAEAIRDAQENFNAFTGEVSAFEDVFLGLADSFSPLQKAFLETGQGVGDVQRLMKQAQKDPLAFAESVDQIKASLDPHMARRFEKQVLANLPEATRQIITFEKARQEAIAAGNTEELERLERQKTAAEKQEQFNKLISDMRGNVVDARNRLVALMEVFKAEVGKDFAEDVMQGLEGIVRWVGKAIRSYRDFRDGLDTEQMNKFGKAISGVVAAGTALGPVFGGMLAFLTPLGSAFGLVWRGASKLTGMLTAIIGKSGKATGSFKLLGGIIKRLALPLGLIIAAIDGFKEEFFNIIDIISDPSKSGADKIEKVFEQVVSGLWDTFDNFFLGLPGAFKEAFTTGIVSVSTDAERSFGKVIGDALGTVTKVIVDKSVEWGKAFKAWLSWDNVNDLVQRILTGFAAMGHKILGFLAGIGEGFSEAMGVPWEETVFIMQSAWLNVKHSLINGMSDVYDWFAEVGDSIQMIWNEASYNLSQSWKRDRQEDEVSALEWKNSFLNIVGMVQVAWGDVTAWMADKFAVFVRFGVDQAMNLLAPIHAVADALGLDIADGVATAMQAVAGIQIKMDEVAEQRKKQAVDTRAQVAQEMIDREKAVIKLRADHEAENAYAQQMHDAEIQRIQAEGAAREAANKERLAGQAAERDALEQQFKQDMRQRRERKAMEAAEAEAAANREAVAKELGMSGKSATVVNEATGQTRSAPVASPEEAAAAAGGSSGPAQIANGASAVDPAAMSRLANVLEAMASNDATTGQARNVLAGAFNTTSAGQLTESQIKEIKLNVNPNAGRLLDAVLKSLEAESINGTR